MGMYTMSSLTKCTTISNYHDRNRIVIHCQRQLVWHHVKLDMLALVKRHLTDTEYFTLH